MVEQGAAGRSDPHQIDSHLAVFGLSQTAAILPRRAHAFAAPFDHRRLVDHADRADRPLRCRGNQLFGEDRLDFSLHGAPFPGGSGDEALHGDHLLFRRRSPVFTFGKPQGDRFDVLASLVGDQPSKVDLRMLSRFPATEQGGESLVPACHPAAGGAQLVPCHRIVLLTEARKQGTGRP